MVVKESKVIEEDSLDKRIRLRKEKRVKEASDAKQKIVDDANEQKRMENIIFPYLDKLSESLKEKKSFTFWTFPDRSGFKKIKNYDYKEIQKFLDKDPGKYADRNIIHFSIITYHRSNDDSKYSFKTMGTFLGVSILVNPIDKNGKMKNVGSWGGKFIWKAKDFKITKLSFKLLERIMEIVVSDHMSFASLTGTNITDLLIDFKRSGYDLSDVLSPLAGV